MHAFWSNRLGQYNIRTYLYIGALTAPCHADRQASERSVVRRVQVRDTTFA